jgi:hypothetical protein
MSITVTGPLATPVVTLTPGSGGTLAAATYEIGVACANTSSYSTIQVDQRRSAAWIGQVTVTANQKITVSYPAVTNATHYNIYIRNVTTGETWYGGNRRHGSADLTATTTATTYDILSLGTRRPHFDSFAYDTTYFLPGGIALNTGTVVMHISGTDVVGYYYSHFLSALTTAGYADYMSFVNGQWYLKGQIVVDSGATGSLAPYTIKDISDYCLNAGVHFLQGIIINNSSTFTISWGSTQRGAVLYQEAWSWNIDSKYMDFTECSIQGGNWQQNRAQTYIWGGDHYFIVNNNTISTTGLSLKGVNVQNQKTNGPVTGIKTNGSLLIQTANATYQYCESNGTGTLATFSAGQTANWKDSTISNATFSRHHRPRNSVPGGVFFWNVKWKNDTTSLPTAGPLFLERPEIYYESGSGGLTNIFYQGTSFQVKVVDNAGNPIESATVTLYNNTKSTQTLSTLTSADGTISSQDVVYEEGTYDNSGVYGNGTGSDYSWLHTNWTAYNFTLTISKNGYPTKEIKGVTFKTPYYAVVTLGDVAPTDKILLNEITEGVYLGQ